MVHIMPVIDHIETYKKGLANGCYTAFTYKESSSKNLGWREFSVTMLLGDRTTFQVHVGQSNFLFFIANLKPIDL